MDPETARGLEYLMLAMGKSDGAAVNSTYAQELNARIWEQIKPPGT